MRVVEHLLAGLDVQSAKLVLALHDGPRGAAMDTQRLGLLHPMCRNPRRPMLRPGVAVNQCRPLSRSAKSSEENRSRGARMITLGT